MNKIFNRQLFRTSARRPTAHGSGITQLVVDNKPVQGFAFGTGERGVEDPGVIDPNPMYANLGSSDIPEIGISPSEEPRVQVASTTTASVNSCSIGCSTRITLISSATSSGRIII